MNKFSLKNTLAVEAFRRSTIVERKKICQIKIESFEPEIRDNSGDSADKLFSGIANFVILSKEKVKEKIQRATAYITIKISPKKEIEPGYYQLVKSKEDGVCYKPVI